MKLKFLSILLVLCVLALAGCTPSTPKDGNLSGIDTPSLNPGETSAASDSATRTDAPSATADGKQNPAPDNRPAPVTAAETDAPAQPGNSGSTGNSGNSGNSGNTGNTGNSGKTGSTEPTEVLATSDPDELPIIVIEPEPSANQPAPTEGTTIQIPSDQPTDPASGNSGLDDDELPIIPIGG